MRDFVIAIISAFAGAGILLAVCAVLFWLDTRLS